MNAYCGMEVVLANGEVLRTGMGAMPNNRSWHVYKRSLGPTLDQLFMQSNFGIVTKLGVWLMPWPECYMPLWLRVWKDDDLGPVVDTLRRADARPHDRERAADLEHDLDGVGDLEPGAVVPGRGPDPGRRDRPHGAASSRSGAG